MRIVIDLQSCQTGSRFGGIGRYALALTKAVIRNSVNKHDIHIVFNGTLVEPLQALIPDLLKHIPESNLHVFSVPKPVILTVQNNKKDMAEILREQFIRNLNPDAVLIMSVFEGIHEEVTISIKKFFDIPTAAILYDLIPIIYQDSFLKVPGEKEMYRYRLDQIIKSDVMLAVSEFSRQEALTLLSLDSEKIATISSAIDEPPKTTLTKSEKANLTRKFRITKPFIMFTSSFCHRKNHRGLIKAFSKLPEVLRSKYQLVFVGNSWKEKNHELWNYANNLGVDPSDVIITMKIPDADMYGLYSMCSLFVFPSMLEGFGLPVLEAMAFDIPTIGSNTTSIPEVIGLKEATFDPEDAEDMARVIERGLTDNDFRKKLIENGKERSKLFSWDLSAQRTLEALEKVVNKKKESLEGEV